MRVCADTLEMMSEREAEWWKGHENGGYDPVIDDLLMDKFVEITIEESFVVKVQKKLPQ